MNCSLFPSAPKVPRTSIVRRFPNFPILPWILKLPRKRVSVLRMSSVDPYNMAFLEQPYLHAVNTKLANV